MSYKVSSIQILHRAYVYIVGLSNITWTCFLDKSKMCFDISCLCRCQEIHSPLLSECPRAHRTTPLLVSECPIGPIELKLVRYASVLSSRSLFTRCIPVEEGQSVKISVMGTANVLTSTSRNESRVWASWGPQNCVANVTACFSDISIKEVTTLPGHVRDFAWYRGQRPSTARVIKMSYNNNSRTRKCGGFVA